MPRSGEGRRRIGLVRRGHSSSPRRSLARHRRPGAARAAAARSCRRPASAPRPTSSSSRRPCSIARASSSPAWARPTSRSRSRASRARSSRSISSSTRRRPPRPRRPPPTPRSRPTSRRRTAASSCWSSTRQPVAATPEVDHRLGAASGRCAMPPKDQIGLLTFPGAGAERRLHHRPRQGRRRADAGGRRRRAGAAVPAVQHQHLGSDPDGGAGPVRPQRRHRTRVPGQPAAVSDRDRHAGQDDGARRAGPDPAGAALAAGDDARPGQRCPGRSTPCCCRPAGR